MSHQFWSLNNKKNYWQIPNRLFQIRSIWWKLFLVRKRTTQLKPWWISKILIRTARVFLKRIILFSPKMAHSFQEYWVHKFSHPSLTFSSMSVSPYWKKWLMSHFLISDKGHISVKKKIIKWPLTFTSWFWFHKSIHEAIIWLYFDCNYTKGNCQGLKGHISNLIQNSKI